ncbi:6-bladed beta-propeller [Candidatus Aminicenantes bacterium AC-335-B20]|nr:6-bladed beta-propeller [SCandidatus Aminicenantes bacterium Aminicenantia_JdfR_composite]MCP2598547.1 6-bladed beta-propeller [Candidatus Aminicenantes bacterium AC-335-L06]MCP2598860.1 6-bladed beta-propeller [Candidatus Aminicenantes bacterium AC-335-B20]
MKNIRIIVILYIILRFLEFRICLAEDFQKFFSKEKTIILKEDKRVIISSIEDIDIDSKGNIWIIDWTNSELYRFDRNGNFPVLIARKGQGPGELPMMPESIFINEEDHVFVVTLFNRVTEFDSNGKYVNSFITTDGHIPSTCIAVNSEGNVLIGGPKKRWRGDSYTAQMIHMYSREGKYLKSFCPIDEKVIRLGLGRYRSIYFDLDEYDNIYTVQPVNYLVKVFDKNGKFLKSFGKRHKYYKEPKRLTKEIERDKNKMEEWEKNFTYVKGVFVFDDKVAVISKNYLGSNNWEYFIDIYNHNSGKLIASGIRTDLNLHRVKNGKFYFLKILEKKGKIQYIIEIYKFKMK